MGGLFLVEDVEITGDGDGALALLIFDGLDGFEIIVEGVSGGGRVGELEPIEIIVDGGSEAESVGGIEIYFGEKCWDACDFSLDERGEGLGIIVEGLTKDGIGVGAEGEDLVAAESEGLAGGGKGEIFGELGDGESGFFVIFGGGEIDGEESGEASMGFEHGEAFEDFGIGDSGEVEGPPFLESGFIWGDGGEDFFEEGNGIAIGLGPGAEEEGEGGVAVGLFEEELEESGGEHLIGGLEGRGKLFLMGGEDFGDGGDFIDGEEAFEEAIFDAVGALGGELDGALDEPPGGFAVGLAAFDAEVSVSVFEEESANDLFLEVDGGGIVADAGIDLDFEAWEGLDEADFCGGEIGSWAGLIDDDDDGSFPEVVFAEELEDLVFDLFGEA
jgi:hypothetical protein